MEKKYLKADFRAGNTIEDAVNELLSYKEKGVLVSGDFNGNILYSDTVTMDGAYKMITGKSKYEFDKQLEERLESYDKKKREHQELIPELIEYWMKRGREILTKDKLEVWDEIVPIRLNDLYLGMELGNCLDIIEILNNDENLDKAKELIESQNHSGMSFSLVCAMVKEFSDRGTEFVEYAN